jgi:hypothetical protein
VPSFVPFNAAGKPPQDVAAIVGDYLALDRVRFWRRLLAVRFGLLALAVLAVSRMVPGLSRSGHWVPLLVCLAPPAWAALTEFRLARRLSRRLQRAGACPLDTLTVHAVTLETDL